MAIGDRIKLARNAKDLTLEELSEKLNLSRQTLSRYETGVIQNIPSDNIELIAKTLDVEPAYLMGWQNGNAAYTNAVDIIEDENMLTIPAELHGKLFAFNRGEFEDLNQDEIDLLAGFALTLKAKRKDG